MKKKILLILLSLVIGLCVSVPAFAAQADGFASEYERVQDLADLLSDSEEAALLEKLDELCERQKMEIVVLTTDTLEGLAPRGLCRRYLRLLRFRLWGRQGRCAAPYQHGGQ